MKKRKTFAQAPHRNKHLSSILPRGTHTSTQYNTSIMSSSLQPSSSNRNPETDHFYHKGVRVVTTPVPLAELLARSHDAQREAPGWRRKYSRRRRRRRARRYPQTRDLTSTSFTATAPSSPTHSRIFHPRYMQIARQIPFLASSLVSMLVNADDSFDVNRDALVLLVAECRREAHSGNHSGNRGRGTRAISSPAYERDVAQIGIAPVNRRRASPKVFSAGEDVWMNVGTRAGDHVQAGIRRRTGGVTLTADQCRVSDAPKIVSPRALTSVHFPRDVQSASQEPEGRKRREGCTDTVRMSKSPGDSVQRIEPQSKIDYQGGGPRASGNSEMCDGSSMSWRPAEPTGGEFQRMMGSNRDSDVQRIPSLFDCFQSKCEARNGNTEDHEGRRSRFRREARRRVRKIGEVLRKISVGALEKVCGLHQ